MIKLPISLSCDFDETLLPPGPAGADGTQGPQGIPGEPGPAGQNASVPTVSLAGTELALSVPIGTGSNKVVVFSVPMVLVPSDVVMIIGQVEVTNPYSINVGFGRYLVRTTSPTAVTGTVLQPANMDNVTPNMHHKSEKILGVDTGVNGTVYYNYVVYAAATSPPANSNLIIEQGYGNMKVVKFGYG